MTVFSENFPPFESTGVIFGHILGVPQVWPLTRDLNKLYLARIESVLFTTFECKEQAIVKDNGEKR